MHDGLRGYFVAWQARILYRKGDANESILALNKVLPVQPYSKDDFYARYCAEEVSKQYGPAAQDLYSWHTRYSPEEFVPYGDSDPQYTLKQLGDCVKRFPKLGNPRIRRAHFLEALGDLEQSPQKQSDYYERALADFESSIKMIDCSEIAALYGCGKLSCKLHRLDDVKQYMDKIASVDNSVVEKSVLEIAYLYYNGKNEEVLKPYSELKDRLLCNNRMKKPAGKFPDYLTKLP